MLTVKKSLVNENSDYKLKEHTCAAKVNLAVLLVPKNNKKGSCRNISSGEINTVLKESKLVCNAMDMTKSEQKTLEKGCYWPLHPGTI